MMILVLTTMMKVTVIVITQGDDVIGIDDDDDIGIDDDDDGANVN